MSNLQEDEALIRLHGSKGNDSCRRNLVRAPCVQHQDLWVKIRSAAGGAINSQGPSGQHVNYNAPSDEELIKRVCGRPPDAEAVAVFSRRCLPKHENIIRTVMETNLIQKTKKPLQGVRFQ
jgi:hypothetical protein